MAKGREFIVETDFLFGLRPSDELHNQVKEALERNLENKFELRVSGVAPIEASAVMSSQGADENKISEGLSLIEADFGKYDLKKYTIVTISDMRASFDMRQIHEDLTFFDSIHAAISDREGVPILSSDPIYEDTTVEWENLRELV